MRAYSLRRRAAERPDGEKPCAAADARAIEDDFYQKAFGPAAEPTRRFYRRWECGLDLDAALPMPYRDLQEAPAHGC